MADISQIKDLLSLGLTNEQVATATGVSPSYISQLMADVKFANEVVAARAANLQAATLRDREYDKLEDRFIKKLDEAADMMYKPREILSALATINKMQRRGAPQQQAMSANTTIVQLNIPNFLVQQNQQIEQQVVMSANKEVIEIDGQTMVTMPSHQLLKQLAQTALQESDAAKGAGKHDDQQIATERAKRYEAISRFLPTAASSGA